MSEQWLTLGLAPESPQVAPGGRVEVTAKLRNVSAVVDQYGIAIDGLDPAWYTLAQPSVSLFPGDEASVQFTLHPPAEAVAGAHPFTVRAFSSTDPSRQASAGGGLSVGAIEGYSLSLSPERASGRVGDYQLQVTNHGNAPLRLALEGRDDEGALDYRLSQSEVEVPPGGQAQVGLRVKPRAGRWSGAASQHRFRVVGWPAGEAMIEAEVVSVAAELEYRPMLGVLPAVPRAPLYAALAAIPLLIALWLWLQPTLGGGSAAQASPTAPAVAAAPTPAASAAKPAGAATPSPTRGSSAVAGGPPPSILHLDLFANQDYLKAGVVVDWHTEGDVASKGDWRGGGQDTVPFRGGSFAIVAQSGGGQAEEQVHLAVVGPPIIKSFFASAEVAPPGESVTLLWDVAGASKADLNGKPVDLPTGKMALPVASDQYVVLTASNGVGTVSSAVRVRPGTPPSPLATATPTPTPTLTPTTSATATATATYTLTPTATPTPISPPSVIATIPVGAGPVGIDRRPSTGWFYVAAMNANEIEAIDPATRRVTRVRGGMNRPIDVGISSDSRWLYVTNRGSNSLSAIDLAPPIGAEFPDWARGTGASPYGLALRPSAANGLPVVVANSGTSGPGTVSVISSASSSYTANVGNGPRGVVILPNGSRTYITNTSERTVTVYNGIPALRTPPIAIISVGGAPIGIAASPKSDRVYVANRELNALQVIDTGSNSIIATVGVGTSPVGVAEGPEGRWVYVMNEGSGNVSVVDTTTMRNIGNVGVGSSPQDAATSQDGRTIYVTNMNSNSVSVLQWPLIIVPIIR